MSTGQTMLSIIAFMFLGTLLMNFYRLINTSDDDMGSSQDVIIGTALAQTYVEYAQSMNFDEKSINKNIRLLTELTSVSSLGPDGEPNMEGFDDVDDFNNHTRVDTAGANNGRFTSQFKVYYITETDVNSPASSRTWMKRLDVKLWRSDRPGARDTVRMFATMGYFRYN